jgi:hypothetical protein
MSAIQCYFLGVWFVVVRITDFATLADGLEYRDAIMAAGTCLITARPNQIRSHPRF